MAEKIILSGFIEPIDVIKHLPKHHYNNIIQLTSEIIEDTIKTSKKANQFQLYKFLSKFHNYLNDHEICKLGLRPSDNFIKTQMCLAMTHGVTITLCKDNYIGVANIVLNELFHTELLESE
jgi:hypothetical protein